MARFRAWFVLSLLAVPLLPWAAGTHEGAGGSIVAPHGALALGAREHASGVVVGPYLYVIGGVDANGRTLSDIVRLLPSTGEEHSVTLPDWTGRAGAAAVWNGSRILVFGGVNDTCGECRTAYNDVLAIDPAGPSFTVLVPNDFEKPRLSFGTAAVALGGKIYLFGGCDEWWSTCTSDVREFDPETLRFRLVASLPEAVTGVSALDRGDGSILVMGGWRPYPHSAPVDDVFRFSPETGQLVALQPRLPEPRGFASAFWVDNRAYLVGGENASGGHTPRILRYHPAAQTVANLTSVLPSGLAHSAHGLLGDYAYVVGGHDESYQAKPDIVQLSLAPLAVGATARGPDVLVRTHRALADGSYDASGFVVMRNHAPVLPSSATVSSGNLTLTIPGGAASADVLTLLYAPTGAGPRDAEGNELRAFGGLAVDVTTPRHELPAARLRPAVVPVGDAVLVVGGVVSRQCTGTACSDGSILRYWPANGTTLTGPNVGFDCCGAAVAVGGYVLILGGEGAARGAILRLDPATGVAPWIGELPDARSHVGAASDGVGAVYAFGGISSCETECQEPYRRHAEILRIDAATGVVTPVGALPAPRYQATAAWVASPDCPEGCVYVLGGWNATDVPVLDIVRFDPRTNATTVVGALPSARSDAAAFVAGASVWLVGGENATAALDDALRFFPAGPRSVTLHEALARPRSAGGAAWDGSSAYVLGGFDRAGVPILPIVRLLPDLTPPALTMALSPASPSGLGGYYNRSVAAFFNATESATVHTSLDNVTFEPTAVRLLNATADLWARAQDADGNVALLGPRRVLVDTVAPTVLASGDLGELPGANATIVFTFSEPMERTRTEAALRNTSGWAAAWSAGDSVLSLTRASVPVGTHALEITTAAQDAHGVLLAAGTSRAVTRVDREGPTLTVLQTPAAPNGLAGFYNTSVAFGLEATDDVGVASLGWSLDGVQFQEATSFALSHGTHSLFMRATDTSGRSTYANRTLAIDTVPPTVVVSGSNGTLEGASATVALTFSEPMDRNSTTAALRNVSGWTQAWSANDTVLTLTRSDVPLGTHVVEITGSAQDAHGVFLAAGASRTIVRADGAPPAIAIQQSPATPNGLLGFYNTSVSFVISATDDVGIASFGWSLDGLSFNATPSFALGEGHHALVVRAVDLAGKVAFANRTVPVDSTRPTVAVGGSNGTLSGSAATVVFTFSEPMDRNSTQAALANASGWTSAWSSNDSILTLSHENVPIGTHVLEIGPTALDAHGNAIAAGGSRTLTRPSPPPAQDPPASSSTPPPQPATTAPGVVRDLALVADGLRANLTWTAPASDGGSAVTGYRVYVDGALAGETNQTRFTTAALARGALHVVRVHALNSIGEGAAAIVSMPLPPVSTILVPEPGASGWYLARPTARLETDPENATVYIESLEGEPRFTNTTSPAQERIPGGVTRVRWQAFVGDLREPMQERTFRVDPDPPVVENAFASATALAAGQPLTVIARASDSLSGLAGVELETGGGSRLPMERGADESYRVTFTPSSGETSLVVVATDVAGHETRAPAGVVAVSAPPPPAPDVVSPPDAGAGGTPGGQGSGATGPTTDSEAQPPTTSPDGTTPASQDGVDPASAPEPTIVIEQLEGVAGAGVRGIVTIRLTGVPDLERVFVVAIDKDGVETILSEGQEVTEWNTTLVADGFYTLEVRRRSAPPAPGEVVIASNHAGGALLASARVLVRNDVSPPAAVAVAVAGGVIVAAAAHVGLSAAAGSATSAAQSAAGGFDPLGFAQEVAIDAGQDKFKDKTKERVALDRRRRIGSLVAAGISLVILGALWALAEAEAWTLAAWLVALPVVGAAAAVVTILKYVAEAALAWVTHARPRVRLWVAGAIALLVSSLAFRNPFGYPGYVDEVGESEARNTWRMQGLRGLATIAGAVAFMLPFLALAAALPWEFVSVGLLLAVTNAATTAMPFGPLPGRDVWRWSKPLAVVVALAGFALYVAYAAALAPVWSLWAVSAVCGAAYVFAIVRFRQVFGPRPAPVRVPVAVPVPVVDADAAAGQAEPVAPAGAVGGADRPKRRKARRKK